MKEYALAKGLMADKWFLFCPNGDEKSFIVQHRKTISQIDGDQPLTLDDMNFIRSQMNLEVTTIRLKPIKDESSSKLVG